MKKILFGSLAVVFAVALVSFTNASTSKAKFACVKWFVYDDPAITNPALDFPTTATQAKTVGNWTPVADETAALALCSQTVRLCAICADHTQTISGVVRPQFVSGDAIITQIDSYFLSNDPSVDDSQNYPRLKEKFTN